MYGNSLSVSIFGRNPFILFQLVDQRNPRLCERFCGGGVFAAFENAGTWLLKRLIWLVLHGIIAPFATNVCDAACSEGAGRLLAQLRGNLLI